jgi:preprotein translocase subunit Sss1
MSRSNDVVAIIFFIVGTIWFLVDLLRTLL